MNSSTQRSADGAPHEHQVKAESLIQQKDEYSHNSKNWEWPPACMTERKFSDQQKRRTHGTERNVHREEEVLAEDRRQGSLTILERFSHRRERDEDRRPASDTGRPNDHAANRPRCNPSSRGWTQPRVSHSGVGNHRYSEGSRRVSQTRERSRSCCNLQCRGARASTANRRSRSGTLWCWGCTRRTSMQ